MESSFEQWLETVIGDRDDYSSGLRAYLNYKDFPVLAMVLMT
jgi:hypothetical protein